MVKQPVWIGITVGVFFAGLGIGFAAFSNSEQPENLVYDRTMFGHMMGQNNQAMSWMMEDPQLRQQMFQHMLQSPEEMNQWMNTMMSDPQLMSQWQQTIMNDPQMQQQMYQNMLSNQQFMQGMMENQQFQSQWMNPMTGNTAGMHTGSGMMGNMMSGQEDNYKSISMKDAVYAMNNLPDGTTVDKEKDSIDFGSSKADVTALAMMKMDAVDLTGYSSIPDDHAEEDVFVIGNMINPTLIVKSGTTLQVTVVNMDEDMGHNFVVTPMNPPYSVMPMQGMMSGNDGFLNSMPIIPTEQDGKAYKSTTSLTLTEPGTYYYICAYPGHAAEGMYGKIIVQ